MERGKTDIRRHLCPVRNSAKMCAVTEHEQAGAVPLRGGDADRHGLAADHLAEAVVAVDNDQCAGV
jgi:hypothetical protein